MNAILLAGVLALLRMTAINQIQMPSGTVFNEAWFDANCPSQTACPIHFSGVITSGCSLTSPCNHAGVKFYGDGKGYYALKDPNGNYVSQGQYVIGPSIIQCSVDIYTGADNWEFHDLSIDVGDALVGSGKCAEGGGIDAFSDYKGVQLAPIRNIKVSNVEILLRNSTSMFHGFKCENVQGCSVDHTDALFGVHGFTFKCGSNFHAEDLWAGGHAFDDYIIKAGETGYVPCNLSEAWLRDSTATYAQPGDTGVGVVLQWQNGNLIDVTLTNINYVGLTEQVNKGGDTGFTGTPIWINNERVK